MFVYGPNQALCGFLFITFLASGCGDASATKAAPGSQDSGATAKNSAPARKEIDHPQGQNKKLGAVANQNGSSDPSTPEHPTIYSSLELAKIVDFTKLPKPEGATPLSRNLFSRLEMKVPSKVPQAAAFYLDKLTALGWTIDESPGQKTINDSEAVATLTKNGHVITVSGFPNDIKKPECMMMLVFYGNLDAQTLPKSNGAKLLYGNQTQLIYTTATKVSDEAEWVTKTLSGQGWRPYVRANTSVAKSDDLRILDFIKQGYSVDVMINQAPAQNNQTAVHYSVHALGHELPAPPNASGIEFDDEAWTLNCEMSSPIDAGVAFYQQAMIAAGYKALPGEQPQDKYVNMRFGTEPGDVVLVQVAKKDDKTSKISIHGISAAVMEEIRKEDKKKVKEARGN
jgi:hypothetical protein